MSLFDYRVSMDLAAKDLPFYALIMTAMRQADDDNVEKLKEAWPDVWRELHFRYHAPDGQLEGEERWP
ncbi:hypothetical protein LCGC14_2315790 [marine sediment metagenome]|uniref:Uncharacterized protein n=1 Tax=marine sediment metagenome TaxID=412755 RepID=A0A0F9FE73_9ZZZZ